MRFSKLLAAVICSAAFIIQSAQALTLDAFEGEGSVGVTTVGAINKVVVNSDTAIGGKRTLITQKTSNSGIGVQLRTVSGLLSHNQDIQVTAVSTIIWDADNNADTINYAGFAGIDLTQDGSTAFVFEQLNYDFSDSQNTSLKLKIFSASDPSGNTFTEHEIILSKKYDNENLIVQFAGNFNLAYLKNVGAISLEIIGSVKSADLGLDTFSTNGNCALTPSLASKKVVDDCSVCGGHNQAKDTCGVCFGDNSAKDSCGVCFGKNASLDDCGICGGKNLTKDLCGICGGNNSSCLDCAGTPKGTAKLDTCGICAGNGLSCSSCPESSLAKTIQNLKKQSNKQKTFALTQLKRFKQSDGTYFENTKLELEQLQTQFNKLIASLPTTIKQCGTTAKCHTVSTNALTTAQYENLVRLLYQKTSKIIYRQPKSTGSKPAPCPGKISDCLAKIKADQQKKKALLNTARKLRDSQLALTQAVPGSFSACD